MENAKAANPVIDNVVSRGWPEIYSGVDAYASGAFYQVPVVQEGKITPSQKTGLACIKEHIPENKRQASPIPPDLRQFTVS